MTGETDYRWAFSVLMLVVGVTMLGCTIPFAIANYRLDDCTATLHARLDAIKTTIDATQGAARQR